MVEWLSAMVGFGVNVGLIVGFDGGGCEELCLNCNLCYGEVI